MTAPLEKAYKALLEWFENNLFKSNVDKYHLLVSSIPDSYKSVPKFCIFKNRIKKWKPKNCPCRPCKMLISRIGFT